jgi:hypothetical protein
MLSGPPLSQLEQLLPIAPVRGPALELSTLCCLTMHNNTLEVLQRHNNTLEILQRHNNTLEVFPDNINTKENIRNKIKRNLIKTNYNTINVSSGSDIHSTTVFSNIFTKRGFH